MPETDDAVTRLDRAATLAEAQGISAVQAAFVALNRCADAWMKETKGQRLPTPEKIGTMLAHFGQCSREVCNGLGKAIRACLQHEQVSAALAGLRAEAALEAAAEEAADEPADAAEPEPATAGAE